MSQAGWVDSTASVACLLMTESVNKPSSLMMKWSESQAVGSMGHQEVWGWLESNPQGECEMMKVPITHLYCRKEVQGGVYSPYTPILWSDFLTKVTC